MATIKNWPRIEADDEYGIYTWRYKKTTENRNRIRVSATGMGKDPWRIYLEVYDPETGDVISSKMITDEGRTDYSKKGALTQARDWMKQHTDTHSRNLVAITR